MCKDADNNDLNIFPEDVFPEDVFPEDIFPSDIFPRPHSQESEEDE